MTANRGMFLPDETDLRILDALQRDCSVSMADLGETVGLSNTPLWRRMKRLESEGVIRGRVALLDAEKLGLEINIFASIRLDRHDEETLEAFERAAVQQAEIMECYSMSGESDFLLRVVVDSISYYERYLKRVLLHLPGVAAVNSHFTLKRVKQTTELPLRRMS
ncbi:Lrp/AsnC family transcriptional regulator [Notoacmeibacter sp. MSK16QG-6]|uniref:Lrp/AsnC family transcriptional regulator n=1 Tax=Notoacmeibacter sp. MSK16QG-6 TaxID=2957982 RepID=UPI00209FB19C|nr:Lrp/AsnC family transcriptional regulator [Notoacmeibacter sp. MSK16QG-6]MCP1200800.1 Lrp/AsnC family transcriptional regulator [Notoacmeibacter sp. MSK16QG-6]